MCYGSLMCLVWTQTKLSNQNVLQMNYPRQLKIYLYRKICCSDMQPCKGSLEFSQQQAGPGYDDDDDNDGGVNGDSDNDDGNDDDVGDNNGYDDGYDDNDNVKDNDNDGSIA